MSILDTTAYFRSVYTQEYMPFENDNYNENKHDKNKWDNFCPKCHYNYNSHYHKTRCNNQLPIGDELLPFSIIILIYLIIKIKWKQ